jgi:hypothetical protein
VAGQHRAEPAAGDAELVLEDDAVVVQLGLSASPIRLVSVPRSQGRGSLE